MGPPFSHQLRLEPQAPAHTAELLALFDAALAGFDDDRPRWSPALLGDLAAGRSNDRGALHWVLRHRSGCLVGYARAVLDPPHAASVRWDLGARYSDHALARHALQATLPELAERHAVASVFAMPRRGNRRALRLLEAAGFLRASAELHGRPPVGADRVLMWRAGSGARKGG